MTIQGCLPKYHAREFAFSLSSSTNRPYCEQHRGQCLEWFPSASRQSFIPVLPFPEHQKQLSGVSRDTAELWEGCCQSLANIPLHTQGWHLLARCSLAAWMLLNLVWSWKKAISKTAECASIPKDSEYYRRNSCWNRMTQECTDV